MTVDDFADVRTGDKGDDLIVALLPRSESAYHKLAEMVTAQRVAEHYGLPSDSVTRILMPNVHAMVFHLRRILGGGVTGSSYLDGHGKTMGYHLLTMPASFK